MTANNLITDCRAYGTGGVILVVGVPGDDDYFKFGFTAEVRVGLPYDSTNPEDVEAHVSIGCIAAHSLGDGCTRADIYKTACDLGSILLGEVRATLRSVKDLDDAIALRALRGLAQEFTMDGEGQVQDFIEGSW